MSDVRVGSTTNGGPVVSPFLLVLFDRHVAATPDRPAFAGDGGAMTYRDVSARARHLSRRLASSGVVAGDRVGVGLPLGADAAVALLAAWRLGATVAFEAAHGSDSTTAPASRPGSGPAFVDRRDPAGLVVGHGAAAAQVRWAVRRWAVTPDDRVVCTARTPAQLCFEVFLALAAGGTVVWPGVGLDTTTLVRTVADRRATIVPLPADLAAAVAAQPLPPGGQVRLILRHEPPYQVPAGWLTGTGGEAWSTYGLAQAGSVLAGGRIDADGPGGGAVIGRPVDGVRLALLDEYGEPVPPGVPGELYLAGDRVPVGLDADPRTTADRLVPDAFGPPGHRMLRLGDRARWRTGGVLQLTEPVAEETDEASGPRCVATPAQPATAWKPETAWESIVASAWTELLGAAPAGPGDDFHAAGGYSLLVPALARRLQQASGMDVPMAELFRAATLAEQAALLHAAAAADGAGDDLVGDTTLDVAIAAPGGAPRRPVRPPARPPRRVLLTGATGFLGAFLLAELLRVWPETRVVCLVRARTAERARQRVEQAARRYGVWSAAMRDRIEALTGDLEQPRLGLTAAAFDDLTGQVDLIVHNAARVNLAEPYARLRAVNVLGTHEILRLAAVRAVPVHFVSTVGVLAGAAGNPDVLAEDRRVPVEQVPANGYLRSKWAADELVREAAARGLPAAIYRPARISGHTGSGATGPDDAFWVLVRACVEVGAAPDGPEFASAAVDLVPVDFVARAIVHLCAHQEPNGTAYTLTNPVPTPVPAVLDAARAAGYELTRVPGGEWADRLARAAATADPGGAVAAAAVLVGREPRPDRLVPPRHYDRTNTLRGLAGAGIECPPIGPDLLEHYLRFFTGSGDWPAPTAPGPAVTAGGRS